MPGAEKQSQGKLDLLLGRLALERGLVTREDLKAALAEQARDVAVTGRQARPLGVILVARGSLTQTQLTLLLEDQKAQSLNPETARRQDKLLGRLLVQQGHVTIDQLNDCLREQAEGADEGVSVPPRLGEILVRKGYCTNEAIAQALATQQKTILTCKGCGKRYNVTNFDPTKTYRCRACQTALDALPALDTIRVMESIGELPTVKTPPPGIPREADAVVPVEPAPSPADVPAGPPFGKYTVVRELGRGGMGVVYEAFDTALKRRVALKTMLETSHPDPTEAAQDEERFIREARLSAKLAKHPNIVAVYEAGVIEKKRYIAMEFIEGRSMAEWRRLGSVNLRKQIALLRDVAAAVHHAHETGIIHRDLKPENVLVDARGVPHVSDFGLAKKAGQNLSVSLTASGMVVGTPAYMSPEQAQGLKTLDRRCDVWALGVMLYEILTGRTPFEGESPIEILMKTLRQRVPPPSSALPEGTALPFDRAIENICLKALAKHAEDRYPTARQFADDLTKWLKGEPVRVVVPKHRAVYQPRKSHAWAWATAVAVVILGAVVWFKSASRPSVDFELTVARNLMKEKSWQKAINTYAQALAKDPANGEAAAGKREAERKLKAQIEEEKRLAAEEAVSVARSEADQKLREVEDRLKRESEAAKQAAAAARNDAEKARKEAEARAKAEEAAKAAAEREKLVAERREAEERARAAESAARKAEADRAAAAQEAARREERLRAKTPAEAEVRAKAAAERAPAAANADPSPADRPAPRGPLPPPRPAPRKAEAEEAPRALLEEAGRAAAAGDLDRAIKACAEVRKKHLKEADKQELQRVEGMLPVQTGLLLFGFDGADRTKFADEVCGPIGKGVESKVVPGASRDGSPCLRVTIHPYERGFARYAAIIARFKDPVFKDWESVSFWYKADRPAQFEFLISYYGFDWQNLFQHNVSLFPPGWTHVVLPRARFSGFGSVTDENALCLNIGCLANPGAPATVLVDSIRIHRKGDPKSPHPVDDRKLAAAAQAVQKIKAEIKGGNIQQASRLYEQALKTHWDSIGCDAMCEIEPVLAAALSPPAVGPAAAPAAGPVIGPAAGDAPVVRDGSPLSAVEAAIEADDFAAAKKALVEASKPGPGRPSDDMLKAIAANISTLQKWHKETEGARKTLSENPDDGPANLAIGRYLCLGKRKWKAGLPLLSKCSDPALQGAAQKDLAEKRDLQDKLEAGDAWWAAADKAKGPDRWRMRHRAAGWYARVLDGLPRQAAERALSRMDAAASDIPAEECDPSDPWFSILKFDGRSLSGFDPLDGTWSARGGCIVNPGGPDGRYICSTRPGRWRRVILEFKGGNPALYFAPSKGKGGIGANMGEWEEFNESKRAVSMSEWHTVVVDFEGGTATFTMDGQHYHATQVSGVLHVTLKAQLGEFRARRLVAFGPGLEP